MLRVLWCPEDLRGLVVVGLSAGPWEEADLDFGVAFEVGVSVAAVDVKSAMTKTEDCTQPIAIALRYIAAPASVCEIQ
jgi:hypothetical protein